MKFSIIIPSYNRAKYILSAINSVVGQNIHQPEIIIVDDGSTDSTSVILQHAIEKGGIRYIYQNNSGPSVARNVGAKQANGDYLIFLDSDDQLTESRIDKLRYEFQSIKILPDLIYSPWITTDANGNIIRSPGKEFASDELIPSLLVRGLAHPGACVFKRNTFLALGGFNETLRGIEDWELCQRFALEQKSFLFFSHQGSKYTKHNKTLSSDVELVLNYALKVVDIGMRHRNTKINARKYLSRVAKIIQYFESCRRLQLVDNQDILLKLLKTVFSLFSPDKFWHDQYKRITLDYIIQNPHVISEIRDQLEANFVKTYIRYN